jgi:hypothetical protein
MTPGDDQQVRALLQGQMIGWLLRGDHMVRLQDVEQTVDDHGDYEHFFTIITGVGHRIRVTVEVEERTA